MCGGKYVTRGEKYVTYGGKLHESLQMYQTGQNIPNFTIINPAGDPSPKVCACANEKQQYCQKCLKVEDSTLQNAGKGVDN